MFFSSTNLWISTVPLPITRTVLSSTLTSTAFIPEFCISNAVSLLITSPAATNTSPVSVFTMSFAATWFAILVARLSFLLNLYLPTFARSYLLSSKNSPLNKFLAASTDGSSPGLNFL